tara:strand:+ start:3431 stop:3817 length:387 start_codon:yes stop_codon:yes gene_type:complete
MLSSTHSQSRHPLKQCGILISALLGVFLVLCVPAYLTAGVTSVEGLAYSSLLCLVPGLIILLMSGYFFREAPPASVMAVSTLTRILIAGIGALIILNIRPDFGLANFSIWLLICYFASLLVETLLIIR